MAYTSGSSSGSQILQDADDLYPAHINENRQSNIASFVVGQTPNCQYYCDGDADNVQIQQALDNCNTAGGGIVFLKEGSYDIEATLTVYSNTTLQGVGWKTILEVAVEDECVYTVNASNITLKDFAIDCNGYYSTSNVNPVYVGVSSTVLIDHLYVHDTQVAIDNSSAAIGGDRVINMIVQNCLVKTVTDYGISLGAALRCKIINNFVWNPANHGIAVVNGAYGNGDYEFAKNNVISGNSIYTDSDGTDNNGIKLRKAIYTVVSNNNIYHTSSSISSLGHGITTDDYDSAADAIANNSNYLSHNVYSNNTIKNYAHGINLLGENDSVISNNTIYMPDVDSSRGINVAGQVTGNATPIYSTRIVIEGNTIEYNTTQTHHTGVIGISIETLCPYCNIKGNSIYYCGYRAIIVVYQSNFTIIEGNTIKDSYEDGINIGFPDASLNYGASYNVVSGNIIRGSSRTANNSRYDILLYAGSTYNTISENQCIADASNKAAYNIVSQATANTNNVMGNIVIGGVTATILMQGTGDKIRNNNGYVTETSGTGTITSAATSVAITHGLSVTPTVDDISIIGAENPTTDVGTIWVDTLGTATFTVNVENAPSTSNFDFGWRAVVL